MIPLPGSKRSYGERARGNTTSASLPYSILKYFMDCYKAPAFATLTAVSPSRDMDWGEMVLPLVIYSRIQQINCVHHIFIFCTFWCFDILKTALPRANQFFEVAKSQARNISDRQTSQSRHTSSMRPHTPGANIPHFIHPRPMCQTTTDHLYRAKPTEITHASQTSAIHPTLPHLSWGNLKRGCRAKLFYGCCSSLLLLPEQSLGFLWP